MKEAETLPASLLTVVKTKTLIMEYVSMPSVDLATRFLYRFKEPIPTIWRKGAVTPYSPIFVGHKSAKQLMEEYGLKQWFKMVTSDMKSPMPQDVQWLLEVDSCNLVEFEIVQKSILK